MRAWLTRAGKHGEREQLALDEKVAVVGWGALPDLSRVTSREQIAPMLREAYPDYGDKRVLNHVAQLWAFRDSMTEGDLVVLPLKARAAVAIGRVTGGYAYRPDLPPDAMHTRPVDWFADVPRTAIGRDLLHSLGAFLTVCEIRRNNAAERLLALAEKGVDPGAVQAAAAGAPPVAQVTDEEAQSAFDVERYAADVINAYIAEKFAGHELARLVEALFVARGMVTWLAPEGPDGGIDVLAGSGPLGMDDPRICIQVKSQQSPVDVRVVRELQGVVGRLKATQGLLVAWGGVTKSTERELRNEFFQVRVWDADTLVHELTTHYDALPEDIRTALPLKRVWTLAADDA
ncbi:MAG TPA: restriction endonuclease [Mycobacteriales bacterium]